jgi:hypothetical protein
VTIEIDPEPTPEEREALLRALVALGDERDGCRAWWQAGISESVDGGPQEPGLD